MGFAARFSARIGAACVAAGLIASAAFLAPGGGVPHARAAEGAGRGDDQRTAALPTAPDRASIIDLRFGRHPDKTRVVIELSKAAPFSVSATSSPAAIVVDLAGLAPGVGAFAQGPGVGLIERYHQETSPNGRRMVFAAKGPVAVKEAFMIPPRDGRQSRLVVDIEPGNTLTQAVTAGGVAGVTLMATPVVSAKPPPPPSRVDPPAPTRQALLVVPRPEAKPPRPAAKPLVVIDPGHGGVDPGALGVGGAYEKDITLAAAKELRRQLEASGRYRVKLTRDTDVFIRLRDRVTVAREAGADLFISLHADIIGSENVRGLSIYTLSSKASDREAEMLAAKENRSDAIGGIDLSVENDQVASILIDLAQRDTMNHSKRFASVALGELRRDVKLLAARPHREAGFAVLTAPDVPSVLIEMGYLSSPTDFELLNSPGHRQKMARDMLRAIDRYFGSINGR